MVPQWLSNRTKLGYQKFCERTSLHGFTELYYTKSKFWLLVWLFTIATAVGLTTYQVIQSINNYIDQPTTTSMQLAKSGDMMYPQLHICYPHWTFWVNFTKALEMGFTKESVLYGLSYMSTVFSATNFDVDQAKNDFLTTLKRNDLETLDNFYRAIRVEPKWTTNSVHIPMDSTEFRPEYGSNTKFCIVINESNILSTISLLSNDNAPRKSSQTTTLSFKVNYVEIEPSHDYLSTAEIEQYNRDWVAREAFGLKSINPNNGKNVNLSMIIYPNKFDTNGIYLSTNFDIYSISMQMSIQKWKNKPDSPCMPGHPWISTNTTCQDKCLMDSFWDISKGSDFDFDSVALSSKELKPANIPVKKRIVFLQNETPEIAKKVTGESSISNYSQIVKKCQSLCITGCEVYNFDFTLTCKTLYDRMNGTDANSQILVLVHYPAESNVLVMTEMDALTWEGFVGNVGGLLGIWTGASILSFLQIVYLCCFTQSEFGGSSPCNTCNSDSVEKKKTTMILQSA